MKRPPRTILVYAQPGFGDVLLATCLIRSFRRAYPDAAIDVLTNHGREAMLEGNPDVRRVRTIPKRPNPIRFLAIIASTAFRYDLTVARAAGDRGTIILRIAGRRFFALFLARRWDTRWKRALTTAWADSGAQAHEAIYHLRLADLAGIERCYEFIPPYDTGAAARVAAVLPDEAPYAVLHPTTHATRKRWTIDGWAALGQRLRASGLRTVITGGPGDDPTYLAEVAAAIGEEPIVLAGKLTLTEIRALIEGAAIYVGVDTSTTHMAAALGAPTLAIYGPGPTRRWAPWPRGYASAEPPFRGVAGVARVGNVCLVKAECPCGVDYRFGCGIEIPGRSRCLEELPAETVVDAALALLATPASPGA